MNNCFFTPSKVITPFLLVFMVYTLVAQTGSGLIVEQNRASPNFSFVTVKDGIDVYLTPGSQPNIVVKADDNLIELVKTEVTGKVLHISMLGSYHKAKKLEVHVLVPQLTGIEASGSSDVYSTSLFNLDKFKLKLSGGSNIFFDMVAKIVYCDISGGSDAELKGQVEHFTAETNSGSDLKAQKLEIKKCKLRVSGGSDAHIWVVEELDMEASGASDIHYRGQPSILHQKAHDASGIHPNRF